VGTKVPVTFIISAKVNVMKLNGGVKGAWTPKLT